jgi:hypothetical protein
MGISAIGKLGPPEVHPHSAQMLVHYGLEYCLHHVEGGGAELAYARGDCWAKRKAALMAWEAFHGKPAPKLKLVA